MEPEGGIGVDAQDGAQGRPVGGNGPANTSAFPLADEMIIEFVPLACVLPQPGVDQLCELGAGQGLTGNAAGRETLASGSEQSVVLAHFALVLHPLVGSLGRSGKRCGHVIEPAPGCPSLAGSVPFSDGSARRIVAGMNHVRRRGADAPALLAHVLATQWPGVRARLIATHTDDGNGRCRGCTVPGYGTPGGRWPCLLASVAIAAEKCRVP